MTVSGAGRGPAAPPRPLGSKHAAAPLGHPGLLLALAVGLVGGPPPAAGQGAAGRAPQAIDCDAFEPAPDGSWMSRARTRIGSGAAARVIEPGVKVGGVGADSSTADIAGLLGSRCGGLY